MTRAVLAAGGQVLANGRDSASLDQLRQGLEPDLRERFHPLAENISDAAGIARLAGSVERQFPSLHGLVNNAYSGRVGPVSAIEAEDFTEACAINLTAPFLLVRQLGPLLRKAGQGLEGGASVVNIASMYGRVSPDPSMYGSTGSNNPAHYGATKAGLIQLTRYLACNFAPDLVRVNSISPGPFPHRPDQISAGFLDELRRRVPMKRIGTADEVAGPVVFLLSAAASYVNGADLAVDGGWTAW